MIPFAIIKGFLGGLPWKNIIIGIFIAGAIFLVFRYIKTAEENRNKVVTLSAANDELKQANADLEAEYKSQIRVLQNNLAAERKREKDYA